MILSELFTTETQYREYALFQEYTMYPVLIKLTKTVMIFLENSLVSGRGTRLVNNSGKLCLIFYSVFIYKS